MHFVTITAAAAALLILGACSQQESEEGVIPEGYKSAVEKAQGVEGKLEDTMQMHREEIDEGER
jgi:major membrane immunogen (membrane-anchored lipoprotein)